jgi:citrate lyase beta subunit
VTDLAAALADALDAELAAVDAELARTYPGDSGGRQPVHTVYVPADRFHRGLTAEWGQDALEAFDAVAAGPADLTAIWGAPGELRERVRAKLVTEPIEDLRIDFEDGYGTRPEAEEDAEIVRAAEELTAAVAAGVAPPFTGIRFRGFEAATRRRGVRTLVGFVEALCARGGVPAGFVVTLPKVTATAQVAALVAVLESVEAECGLPAGTLRFEIQVETPQSVIAPDGTSPLPGMIAAGAGRCSGLHYGTYDYSASCGIAAEYQSLEHPAADHAKAVMQVAAAGTGVRLSDGSTNVMPVGAPAAVREAWALHGRLVRPSLERGFYQGWDLHPAQLPSRFAAVFAFFAGSADSAARRLRAYRERADSGFLDEPATAVALAGFLLRGVDCGALDAEWVTKSVGAPEPDLAALARRPAGRVLDRPQPPIMEP